MSDGPRRRLPLPMDDADERVLTRTIQKDGVKTLLGEEPRGIVKKQGDVSTENAIPAHSAGVVMPRTNVETSEGMFTRNDLRPQISQTSALAAALAEVFASLDPAARKYVKPASVLKDFLAEHDAELAELFRGSTILK